MQDQRDGGPASGGAATASTGGWASTADLRDMVARNVGSQHPTLGLNTKVADAGWWSEGDGHGSCERFAPAAGHLAALDDFAAAHALSRRETEVLLQAAEGRSMKEAAFDLRLSIKTVENYWRRIYLKTGQNAQLAVVAMLFRWSCRDGLHRSAARTRRLSLR